MLEMIVLGQIPGISFQITFTWFIVAAFFGLLWVDYHIQHPAVITTKSSRRNRRQPVRVTRRKA